MKHNLLTAIILAKNEESRIAQTIRSVAWCDRVLVVDDESTDHTREVAAAAGAEVISHPLNDDFAAQRNYADSLVESGWILHIDADETVGSELAREIGEAVKTNNTRAYYIRRMDLFWGKPVTHGEVLRAYRRGYLRLYPIHAGQWTGRVHEKYVPSIQTASLGVPLTHTPHQSITEFLTHINTYSSLRAKELYQSTYRANVLQILIWPWGKFIYTFFIQRGFLDGMGGFTYCFMMSFHSFLVRAKLFQADHLSATHSL